jgi:hypothetical protein
MLAKWSSGLVKLSEIISIELTILPNGTKRLNGVHLSKKKKVVVEIARFEELASAGDLKEMIDIKVPISILISGKGVIHKRVAGLITDDLEKHLQNILPTAKPEDFHFQIYPLNQSQLLVSIIRKTNLAEILDSFSEMGLSLVDVSLGGVVAESMLANHANWANTVKLNIANHAYEFTDDRIMSEYYYSSIDYKTAAHNVDGIELSEHVLIPYLSGLSFLSGVPKYGLHLPEVSGAYLRVVNGKLFSILGWGSILLLLLILTINLVLFFYYSDLNKSLQFDRANYLEIETNLDTLQSRLKKQENFIVNAGWSAPSKLSLFADQIALSCPPSISLTELAVNPLTDQKSRIKTNGYVFKNGVVYIAGFCSNPTILNDWIVKLKDHEWVMKCEIDNYAFDKKEKVGYFILNIEIEK